ncbi:AhpC/TSA family protein [Mucilaginibacter conchicola]|uniref:AhpC/TSA family protein n=1 Tax=Mucilaginibacter conchicola TaxID=2303333 RepID=A0A372NWQ8_9SPHI|nr:TlpA disulfide reductase family protein [Mucilaginibacter conchicola]RFZ94540.1 AhpC/TSA family protein [Mucilaginibacter conchicola]
MLIRKYILSILMLMPILASAQKTFKITGSSKGFAEGDKIYLLYKESGNRHFDSTLVSKGMFSFAGTTNGTGIGSLYRNENPMYADVVHDVVKVFIEPGDIKIITNDSLSNAAVMGTPLNEDNTDLEEALKPFTEKLSKVKNIESLTPEQQTDVKYTNPINVTIDSIRKLMAPVQFAFIKSHPGSYVSLLTLDKLVNHADLSAVADAYNSLSAANKKTELGRAMNLSVNSAKRSQIGVVAAGFELKTSGGKKVKLKDYKGKYILVDFWASWCKPCRDENPNVVAAYDKFKGRNFSIISISIDDKSERKAWLAAIKKDKLPWVQAVDNYEPAKKVKDRYGITTIPANVLIDPSGKIVAKNIKGMELHDTLEKVLK